MSDEKPATILAFDTAGAALSVAVCRGGCALSALHLPMRRGHVELLLPAIDQVLGAAGLVLADMDAVATTVGPGSFTGLRTGLAAAQGLAFGACKTLVGVDRFTALAARISKGAGSDKGSSPIVIAFDSKAGSLYLQAFDADLRLLPSWPAEGRNVTVGEAAEALKGSAPLLAGDGVPLIPDCGIAGVDTGLRALTAPMVAAIAAAELAQGRTGWPPQPLYLAPPRARLPKDGGRLRARGG